MTEAFVKAYSRAIDDYNAAFVDNHTDDAARDDLARIVHKYVESDSPFETARQNLVDGAMRINKGLALSCPAVSNNSTGFAPKAWSRKR